MICKNCGAEVADETKFCQNCGAMIEAEPVPAEAPVYEAVPVEQPAGPGLVWGILGLAFGCSFFASFLGIIFSAIGISKAKKYTKQGYPLTGKNKVGSILSKVGLPVSIVMLVFFIIYVIGVAALVAYNYM